MEYFDPHEKAKLMRHAGAQLLAVTLKQYDPPRRCEPITYRSRVLTDTETSASQTV